MDRGAPLRPPASTGWQRMPQFWRYLYPVCRLAHLWIFSKATKPLPLRAPLPPWLAFLYGPTSKRPQPSALCPGQILLEITASGCAHRSSEDGHGPGVCVWVCACLHARVLYSDLVSLNCTIFYFYLDNWISRLKGFESCFQTSAREAASEDPSCYFFTTSSPKGLWENHTQQCSRVTPGCELRITPGRHGVSKLFESTSLPLFSQYSPRNLPSERKLRGGV